MVENAKQVYKRNAEIRPEMTFPEGMVRIAAGVEYSGTALNGFQKQASSPHTVQEHLERAISFVANEPVTLVCAGRTDAGVHASGQVIHFDTLAHRPSIAWVRGVNTRLPEGVRIHWAQAVSPQFHARFSARSRSYRYLIYNAPVRSAVLGKQVTWTADSLDVNRMQQCLNHLLGEHDFSAFRAAQCQAHSPVREVQFVRLYQSSGFLVLEITANAFLHHMVRNIVGSVMEVGRGRKDVGWIKELLQGRDRSLAAATAPPHGLYLVHVDYSKAFQLPSLTPGPVFIQGPLGVQS